LGKNVQLENNFEKTQKTSGAIDTHVHLSSWDSPQCHRETPTQTETSWRVLEVNTDVVFHRQTRPTMTANTTKNFKFQKISQVHYDFVLYFIVLMFQCLNVSCIIQHW